VCALPFATFHGTCKCSKVVCLDPCTKFHPNKTINVGSKKWKFVYTLKEFMAFTVPIFTKLTISKYIFLDICTHTYSQIAWKWRISEKLSFTPLNKNMPFPVPIFLKLTLAQQLCVKNCYVKVHENMANGLVNYTRSWTDGCSSFH
jgi:hypothetical protein